MQPQPDAETASAAGRTGDDLAGGIPAEGVDERVAAARRVLGEVTDRPLVDHPELFGQVHAHLQQALASIDNA